ncbi:hypothetical protein GIB67_012077 [Kingdonia uniflora]|uniref:XS domain-containing protein n=1 Tax=Kingdonia uniflora TaxID=39325 RepID=A0A7J7LI52_9MAGN|nr:hypothetical protein GIB67_012077 [Kingdonia uniflora]
MVIRSCFGIDDDKKYKYGITSYYNFDGAHSLYCSFLTISCGSDLGFGGGKSKSVFGKEGHQGVTLVKFADDKLGLMEALRLVEHFEKENHGLKGWARALSSQSGRDEENNPYLVKIDEKTGEKKKIYYGYLGTASDLEKVDNDTRKRCDIESRREMMR